MIAVGTMIPIGSTLRQQQLVLNHAGQGAASSQGMMSFADPHSAQCDEACTSQASCHCCEANDVFVLVIRALEATMIVRGLHCLGQWVIPIRAI